MSYLPSDDPARFRKETLGLVLLCLGFTVVLACLVYLTDGVVFSLR